jgi:hypothetical protein
VSNVEKSPAALVENAELITDMARYADGTLTEQQVKQKYRFDADVWEQLGNNDALVEKIEAEKARRIRRGDTARERAQLLFADAPTVLGSIMNDPSSSARHRIESAKELRVVADNGPEASPPASAEKFEIIINLGADVPPLVFSKSITVGPEPSDVDTNQEFARRTTGPDDINSIGHTTVEGVVDDTEVDQLPTPWGLIAASKRTEDGGGQPL